MNIYALYLKYACLFVGSAKNRLCPKSVKKYCRKSEEQWIII